MKSNSDVIFAGSFDINSGCPPAQDSKYNILTTIFVCRVSHGLGHNTQSKGGQKDGGCPHYEVLLKSDTTTHLNYTCQKYQM